MHFVICLLKQMNTNYVCLFEILYGYAFYTDLKYRIHRLRNCEVIYINSCSS